MERIVVNRQTRYVPKGSIKISIKIGYTGKIGEKKKDVEN